MHQPAICRVRTKGKEEKSAATIASILSLWQLVSTCILYHILKKITAKHLLAMLKQQLQIENFRLYSVFLGSRALVPIPFPWQDQPSTEFTSNLLGTNVNSTARSYSSIMKQE